MHLLRRSSVCIKGLANKKHDGVHSANKMWTVFVC